MAIAFTCNSFACNKVSVKDYGAVGNGIVDDTKKFISAVTSNKTILISDGLKDSAKIAQQLVSAFPAETIVNFLKISYLHKNTGYFFN